MECKKCGGHMHKSGKVFSGTKKVQRYRCNVCGSTTTKVDSKSPSVDS